MAKSLALTARSAIARRLLPSLAALLAGCAASPAAGPDQAAPDQAAPPACVSENDCDGDGHPRGPDCDDTESAVHPGAPELPGNGRDDDCDPTTLDGDRIEVPARRALFWAPVPVSITGAGGGRVGKVTLERSVGTVVVDKTELTAFVDERVPWPGVTYTIYQVLAFRGDRLLTLWAYCNADKLEWIYFGGADGSALSVEEAAGSCVEHDRDAYVEVDVPALSLPIPKLVEGFSVTGNALRVASGAVGMVRHDDFMAALLPYRVVDCSTSCGSGPGWYELHSLLWGQGPSSVAFAIVYLYLDPSIGRGRDVALLSSRVLPDLSGSLFPDYSFFDAEVVVP